MATCIHITMNTEHLTLQFLRSTTQIFMDQQAQLAPLDQKEIKVQRVHRAHKECQATQAERDHKDQLEKLDIKVTRVNQDA